MYLSLTTIVGSWDLGGFVMVASEGAGLWTGTNVASRGWLYASRELLAFEEFSATVCAGYTLKTGR